jgi:hypothetical protein
MAKIQRQRQEILRIVGAHGTPGEHDVVAGSLSLAARFASRKPYEWMKPEESDGRVTYELRGAVESFDVGKLMLEHVSAALLRPPSRFGRQQDDGAEHAPGNWQLDLIAREHDDVA